MHALHAERELRPARQHRKRGFPLGVFASGRVRRAIQGLLRAAAADRGREMRCGDIYADCQRSVRRRMIGDDVSGHILDFGSWVLANGGKKEMRLWSW